ncbi:MAG: bifunctional hydroxymethylpyrimidine kinase/phosphomethylpyrimidine kinase [Deltaproteobacteria bacterium]|nr:MAG: bifunctional hydroxymethylpyrimidine kinase/phosphomethylpyrimidine kinase [Deltaproteobacteria bacterium]
MTHPRALTIAGSDSGGGAGIQADLKAFERHAVFGTSAVTLITAQNTRGVDALHMLPVDLVLAQIDAVLSDIGTDAVKTGALGSADMIDAVRTRLDQLDPRIPIVVDPVMVSKHGAPLLPDDAVHAVRERLVPRATVLTPNLHEAAALTGRDIDTEEDMADAAKALIDLGAHAVVVKGGALRAGEAVDLLHDGRSIHRFSRPRALPFAAHGTGCVFSAAICARLALGEGLVEAVHTAKDYILRAIREAPGLGSGHTPVLHRA